MNRWLLFAALGLGLWLSGCAPKLQAGPVEVARVVDGDTVWVRQGSAYVFKLRLIGIDTPEKGYFDNDTGRWQFAPQCYALEASARLRKILARCARSTGSGQAPVFVGDPEKTVGAYGRPLGSLLCNGRSVALQLIAEGYAREFTYRGQDYPARAAHLRAEREARAAGLGGWALRQAQDGALEPVCPDFGKRRASHQPVPSPDEGPVKTEGE